MESRSKTKTRRTYTVTLLTALLFAGLLVTLLDSQPPWTGRASWDGNAKEVAWTFVYLRSAGASASTGSLKRQIAERPRELFFAGPAALAGGGAAPAPPTFFPVWDERTGTGTESRTGTAPAGEAAGPAPAGAAGDRVRFPHLPEDQLPGYGRTAYTVDYGGARFWFLNGVRLVQEPAAQLQWLSRTAEENPQPHRIVLLAEEPAAPEVWRAFTASSVDLVLAGERLWAPAPAVQEQPAAGYRASAHAGWAEWAPAGHGPLVVAGRGPRLQVQPDGGTDRLALDASGLRYAAGVQERAAVSIGAVWRYRPGGADLPAVVPPGLDPAGERPGEASLPVPAGDWRSPAFDDSAWALAEAPFGRSQAAVKHRAIRTPVAAGPSPAVYFRRTFTLEEDPAAGRKASETWVLHAAYEDGIIVYLNGVEVVRDSIRDGLIDYRSLAVPHTGGIFEAFPLTAYQGLLTKGKNTLAVEVHTSHPDAPELWFDLSLESVGKPAGEGASP